MKDTNARTCAEVGCKCGCREIEDRAATIVLEGLSTIGALGLLFSAAGSTPNAPGITMTAQQASDIGFSLEELRGRLQSAFNLIS